MPLPKILIVGQPFNKNTGGGITLTNLFGNWDQEKIAVACSGYLLLDNTEIDICKTYYQLGQKEYKWAFPFNFLARKYPSGLLKTDKETIENANVKKKNFKVSLTLNVLYPLLRYIGLYNFAIKIYLSPELKSWLTSYKPDIIYAQASSRKDIVFCTLLQSYLGKPLIFHMMDDWLPKPKGNGLFSKFWYNKIKIEFESLLEKASILMSISADMGAEYKKRYGKEFITFHNPVDIDFWKNHQKKEFKLNNDPYVLYAGRTGKGIQKSLSLIAKAIEMANKRLNMSIKFVLQTDNPDLELTEFKCVEFRPQTAYKDLPKSFSRADFLILPYDFSKESIDYIGYSMPTKASEYMISGVPIIVFAPRETAVAKYASKYSWASVISKNSEVELAKALEELIINRRKRELLSKNAIEVAERYHDAAKISTNFRNLIRSVT